MSSVPVTQAVQLPNLPIYNGPGLAYFQRGYIQGNCMLCEVFYSQASADVIYGYYAQQLPANGWTITSGNKHFIMAKNEQGATCSVRITPIDNKQYKSSFSLFRNPLK